MTTLELGTKGEGGRGETNQSGAFTLICASCDSSWRIRFYTSASASRSWVGDGGMWMGEPYLVYGIS